MNNITLRILMWKRYQEIVIYTVVFVLSIKYLINKSKIIIVGPDAIVLVNDIGHIRGQILAILIGSPRQVLIRDLSPSEGIFRDEFGPIFSSELDVISLAWNLRGILPQSFQFVVQVFDGIVVPLPC